MFFEGSSPQARNRRSGWLPFAVSVVFHSAALLFVLQPVLPIMPEKSKSEYQQVFAGKEKQIIWYRFKKDLPDVSPALAKSDEKLPLKAEVKAKQAMVASPKNAPKRRQMVWAPAPELAHTQPVESPNLLAIKIPDPAPAPGNPFVAPPDLVRRPAKETAALPDAPALRAAASNSPALPNLPNVAKPFTQPPARVQAQMQAKLRPEVVPLEEAPELRAPVVPRSLKISELSKPVKRFVPPPSAKPTIRALASAPALPDAPDLTASFDSSLPEVFHVPLHVPMSAPRRPFRAPATDARGTIRSSVRVEAVPTTVNTMPNTGATGLAKGSGVLLNRSMPTPDAVRSNSKELNMAVVGLDPKDKSTIPANASPAEFSAGPILRKEGATSSGDVKGLSVPDIFVRGARDAKPDLIARAYAPATSRENIRESMRHSDLGSRANTVQPVPMKMNGAIQVSNAPDPRFQGRDVFMMAIQMPNLTSFSGSWLMWYAERDAQQKGLGAVAPPVAYRKVDPKYIATAVEERVQGRVQLACVIKRDGTVAGVQLVRGVDDRLNRSAVEALAKWEFSPAVRNGEAVDVDVLVEIPFQLAPKVKGPY